MRGTIELNLPIARGERVVVIPAHLADDVAAEAVEMTALKGFVTEELLKGQSILGLCPTREEQTRVDLAAWQHHNKR